MKDLMVVCNNDTCWNSAYNIIECALQLCHQINAFCAVNQHIIKWHKKDSLDNDDRSVCQNTWTPRDRDMFKKLYTLTKLFGNFIMRMEGHAITGLYGVL